MSILNVTFIIASLFGASSPSAPPTGAACVVSPSASHAIPVYFTCTQCYDQYQHCLKYNRTGGSSAIVRCEKAYTKCKSTCK